MTFWSKNLDFCKNYLLPFHFSFSSCRIFVSSRPDFLAWLICRSKEKNSPTRVDRQIESYFDGNQASESIEKSHWRRRRKNPIERKLRPIDFWGYRTMNMQHPSSAVFLLFSSFPGWLTGCNVRQCVGGKSFFPHISIGKPSDAKPIDVNALCCSNCKNPRNVPQFTRLFKSFSWSLKGRHLPSLFCLWRCSRDYFSPFCHLLSVKVCN